ncbi:MAG: putative sulfate exporter family transporter [Candidatus Eremiobacteraeota bacterium]|nr:putative sulfate exporter family transporter [Candidatus Eremiobacteraeota bacterium]
MLGLALCVVVAVIATVLGRYVPIVGAPVFGIVIGVLIAVIAGPKDELKPGITFASKTLLQWSIVLLGANLSVAQIVHGGASSLPVMLGTLTITLALAFAIGKALGLERDLRRLLGVGTAICGGSAIAAVASVIEADQADIAYALGTVFLFNVVAVLLFPALGHAMHMSQSAFGLWSGTAINDTSSVVAASMSYGAVAGSDGIIVKLTRTLLIVPIVVYYAWRRVRSAQTQGRAVAWRAVMPWFVLWFVLAAVLNSLGAIPAELKTRLPVVALFCIVVALAGVGLGTDAGRIRSAGLRPLALGAILWVAISISSLAIASLLHLGQGG